jgi:hypothetical protein
MKIDYDQIEVGTQVLFDGEGILFETLSTALAVFDTDYRKTHPRKWHVGFISRWHPTLGWMICEATGKGVQENPLAIYDSRYYSLYKWHEKPLDDKVTEYVNSVLGVKYDATVYVWVTIATLLNKIFKVNMGRWVNQNLMCWENLSDFNAFMGKSFCKEYKTITISDIMRALNHQG